MQTFRYKDKRVKYYYVLAFAILNLLYLFHLLDNSDDAHVFACVISTIEGLVILFFALSGLREKVDFKDNKVIFVKLFATDVSLDSIRSIQLCDKGDLCYKVNYCGMTAIQTLSFYESEEDITVFRNALAELIRRAREANKGVEVDSRCVSLTDVASEFSAKQATVAQAKRVALTGLGGWLAYIIYTLFGRIIIALRDGFTGSSKLLGNAVVNVVWVSNLYLCVFNFVIITVCVIALIMIFRKKRAFMAWYIYSLICVAVNALFSSIITVFLSTEGFTFSSVLLGIVLPTTSPILWILVWKAYFPRSIRAKNTLIN